MLDRVYSPIKWALRKARNVQAIERFRCLILDDVTGMSSAVPKFVTVNLKDIESYGLDADTEVTLETLKSMGKLKATGADRNLPLKVLGEGDISVSLNFKAAAFSASALAKVCCMHIARQVQSYTVCHQYRH